MFAKYVKSIQFRSEMCRIYNHSLAGYVSKLHANKLLMLYTISLYLTPGDFTRHREKAVAQWDNVEYECEILV
jgi:hypothetical protein